MTSTECGRQERWPKVVEVTSFADFRTSRLKYVHDQQRVGSISALSTSKGEDVDERWPGVSDALIEVGMQAVESWSPGAEISTSTLAGGRSGAAVVRLDMRAGTASGLAGVFILKLLTAEAPVSAQVPDELAAGINPAFAAAHIPALLRTWYGTVSSGEHGAALLYEIAGGSLRRFTTGAHRGSAALSRDVRDIAAKALHAWSLNAEVTDEHPLAVLRAVLPGDQSDEALAVASDFFGSAGVIHEHGHALISPSALFDPRAPRIPLMRCLQHGDFHSGNIVLPLERDEDEVDFFLIDFEKAGISFAGLDHAYLELSLLLDFYPEISSSTLARCLDFVSSYSRGPVPDDMQWIAHVLSEIRGAQLSFMRGTIGREDDLHRQFNIARIAEGLRWATRFKGRKKARLALTYSGWHMLRLLQEYPDEIQPTPIKSSPLLGEQGMTDIAGRNDATAEQPSEVESQLWENLWRASGHFGRTDWTYVLATDRVDDAGEASSLGNIPWSAIIDLDPKSDQDGLYSAAGPTLSVHRAVHVYSDKPPLINPGRGTAWLMSGGWRLRHEPYLDFRQWTRSRLRHVRDLFRRLHESIGDQRVALIVLAGRASSDDIAVGEDRLARVIDAYDEEWGDRGVTLVVGDSQPRTSLEVSYFPLTVQSFTRELGAIFGGKDDASTYKLPSHGGQVSLQSDTLRTLEEHMILLHDQIGVSGPQPTLPNDAFWRGGEITWNDLAENLDVPRSVAPALLDRISESLDSHRTQTVVLQHQPGSGGTTAAMRAAWDLHWKYTVAILPSGRIFTGDRIRLLADRLQRLFVLVDSPVLFVADSSDLPEQYREDLYRELALRNARVTLLYVRRSFAIQHSHIQISTPISEAEGRNFTARFRQLTSDPARIAELDLLGTPQYEKYRSPFFYGLVTYQREFRRIQDHVEYHVREAAGRVRDLLCHLALITLYSNSGLQASLVQRYLLRSSDSSEPVDSEDLFGAAANLVVQRNGRVRIVHQLVAEEILARLVAPDWRTQLSYLAVDFIEDVCSMSDTSSEPTRLLLRQLFIDRVSGGVDGVEDRGDFSPLISDLDDIDPTVGNEVLRQLAELVPDEPHFWNHLGRHQIFQLERDLDLAERFLERAISLAPNDALHYHTLGLARRSRLRQGLRSAQKQGVDALMAVIDALFYRTVDCFDHARALSPDDIYNYITHAQTILQAAHALRTAHNVTSVAEVRNAPGEWIMEQLTIVNSLLDDAVQLYGTLERQDDYLRSCLAEIERLYGDLDNVVRMWEVALARGKTSPFARLALAQAYFVRARRSWRGLTNAELVRIRSLAADNLRNPRARDEDFRFWFESSKLLPDFDAQEALAQLELWFARSESWRSAYYRYVLLFWLWLSERSDDTAAISVAVDDCSRLAVGRKNHSYVWLARDPSWCPLISDSDLGEWDRKKRFWEDSSLLERVNGVIDIINGPAAGTISIADSPVQAFFVPVAGGFIENSDENTPVNFLLGFSPSGLRAWDVKPGASDAAVTRSVRINSGPAFISRPRASEFDRVQANRASELRNNDLRDRCRALIEAASSRGGTVTLEWLAERIRATFGFDGIDDANIRRAVVSLPGVQVTGDGPSAEVVTRRTDLPNAGSEPEEFGSIMHVDASHGWGTIWRPSSATIRFDFADVVNPESLVELRRNGAVQYVVSDGRRGTRAIRVNILPPGTTIYRGRRVTIDELPELVSAEVRSVLEEALAGDNRQLPASEIEDHLERTFVGSVQLGQRLGATGIRAYLRSLSWVIVSGHSGAQTVALRDRVAFGSAHDESAPEVRPLRPVDALDEVVAEIEAASAVASLQQVGPRLKQRIGQQGYEAFVGKVGLKRAIERLGTWSVAEVRPGLVVLSRPGTVRDAAPEVPVRDDQVHPPLRPVDALDEVVAEIEAASAVASLQQVGPRLKQRIGQQGYEAFVGKVGLKRAIERLGTWSVAEVRPGLVVLSRPGTVRDAAPEVPVRDDQVHPPLRPVDALDEVVAEIDEPPV